MTKEYQSIDVLIRDRFVMFVLTAMTIVAALAWNDYIRLAIREKVKDPDLLHDHLIYSIIVTGILLLSIVLFAWLFRSIPGL